jgi:hypothetical protein
MLSGMRSKIFVKFTMITLDIFMIIRHIHLISPSQNKSFLPALIFPFSNVTSTDRRFGYETDFI